MLAYETRLKRKKANRLAMEILRNWYREAQVKDIITYEGINLGEPIEYHLINALRDPILDELKKSENKTKNSD